MESVECRRQREEELEGSIWWGWKYYGAGKSDIGFVQRLDMALSSMNAQYSEFEPTRFSHPTREIFRDGLYEGI
jgi:hypothetical protein